MKYFGKLEFLEKEETKMLLDELMEELRDITQEKLIKTRMRVKKC